MLGKTKPRSSLSPRRLGRHSAGGVAPTVTFPVLISGVADLGDDVFVAQIGTPLTAISCTVSGATITGSTWQWLRNGSPIPLATSQTYTPVAGDDLTTISVRQTLTLSAGSLGPVTSIGFPVQYLAPTLVGSLTAQNFTLSSGVQTYASAGAFSATPGAYTISPGVTGVTISSTTGLVSIDTNTTGPMGGVPFAVNKSNSGGTVSTSFLISVSTDTADDRILRPATTGTSYLRQDLATTAGSGTSTGDTMITAIVRLEAGETFVDGDILSIGNTVDQNAWLGLGMKRAFMSNSGTPASTGPDLADPVGPGWFVVSFTAESDQRRYRILRNAESAINTNGILSPTAYSAWTNKTGKYLSVGARVRGATPTVSNQFRHRICGVMWVRGTGPANTFVTRAQALHDWIYNGGAVRNPSSAVLASFEMSDVGTGETVTGSGDNTLPFFRFSRAGAATFNPAEAAALDIRGPLDTWTAVGNAMTWETPGPPWPVGASVAAYTSSVVPVGATSTVEIVVTLPSGINWSASRTVDVSKIDLRSAYGPGRNPRAVSAATAIAANVCTVTVTLIRPIYVGEPLVLNLATNWLTDSTANGTQPATDVVTTNNSAGAWPALWDGVSFGRCAVTFGTPVAAEFPIANYGVCTHRPTTITEHYPAYETGGAQGHVLHGAEFNPIRRAASAKQGFTLANSASYGINYDAAKVATFPQVMVAGDALIKTYSNIDKYTNGGNATPSQPLYVREYFAVQCTASAAGANQLPPIPVLANTGDARIGFETFDPATVTLPSYSMATIPTRPTIQTLINHLRVFNAGALWASNVIAKRFTTPSGFTLAGGYGTSVCNVANAVAVTIIGDDPIADRRELLRLAVNVGRMMYWTVANSVANRLNADGGQNQGFWYYIVLYLALTGRTSLLATVEAEVGTGELEQSFEWTADLISRLTPHSTVSDTMPRFSLIRPLTAVNAGASQISFADDYDKDLFNGMLIRRVSDGFEATITASSINTTTGIRTLTLSAWPGVGFAISDNVHGKSPYPITAGDDDWTIRGLDLFKWVNLKMNAVYRTPENKWLGEVVGARALGIVHSSHMKVSNYVIRTEQANTPTSVYDLPGHRSSYGSMQVDGPFYDAHWAAISAVPQTVG